MTRRTLVVSLSALALATLAFACRDESEQPVPQVEPVAQRQIPDPPAEGTPTGANRPRTVYVPAYANLPLGPSLRHGATISILLSVRNVDPSATITLTHVDYFDTSGHRVRRYLAKPRALGALETAEFALTAGDKTGGSGANFLVYWEGPSDAHPLLVETVMIAHLGTGYVAFTSRGVELARRPDPGIFTTDGGLAPPSGKAPDPR